MKKILIVFLLFIAIPAFSDQELKDTVRVNKNKDKQDTMKLKPAGLNGNTIKPNPSLFPDKRNYNYSEIVNQVLRNQTSSIEYLNKKVEDLENRLKDLEKNRRMP